MSERLLFRSPQFHEGTNVTCRMGDKWARRLSAEDIVELWDIEGGKLFDAFITDVLLLNVGDIPLDVLSLSHDAEGRTHDGLLSRIREAYPNAIVSVRTKVTVIVFEQCHPAPLEIV